jgi:hypothetical protein
MLRGRLPWGLGGAIYLLVACSQLLVHQCKVIDAFYWGLEDAIKCRVSMLDCTGV